MEKQIFIADPSFPFDRVKFDLRNRNNKPYSAFWTCDWKDDTASTDWIAYCIDHGYSDMISDYLVYCITPKDSAQVYPINCVNAFSSIRLSKINGKFWKNHTTRLMIDFQQMALVYDGIKLVEYPHINLGCDHPMWLTYANSMYSWNVPSTCWMNTKWIESIHCVGPLAEYVDLPVVPIAV